MPPARRGDRALRPEAAPGDGTGVLERLRAAGLLPRRALGQHFLHDPKLLAALAAEAGLGPGDSVFEVGTGPGTLTRELARRAGRVLTVEVDPAMLRFAELELAGFANVSFLQADVLAGGSRLAPAVLESLRAFEPFVWVSNLPYGIASTLIVLLAEAPLRWTRAALTVQAEVAERLTARPGEAAYGPLTLLVAFWMAERRAGRLLPPGAFWPPPRVASRVVHLTPGKPLGTFEEYLRYRDWVKRLFRSRRKQLRGLLRQTLGEARSREALERLGWDPRSRCSDLAPLDYLHLARLFALDFSP